MLGPFKSSTTQKTFKIGSEVHGNIRKALIVVTNA